MKNELIIKYPETTSDYLQMVVACIVREDVDEISLFELIVSAAKHFPFAKMETLKTKQPYNLVVICDQNQGRSQIEEAILRLLANMIGVPLKLKSAGVNATPEKYHGKPSPIVIGAMEGLGIPMDDATVDQLKETDVDENTILIALCAKENIPDFAFKAKVVISHEIKDRFPGSKAPDHMNTLDPLIQEAEWLALHIVMFLAESIEKSDFKIFTDEFEPLILRKPSH